MRAVVITGTGQRHPCIPAYRPGMEVWGTNGCYGRLTEITKWFKYYAIGAVVERLNNLRTLIVSDYDHNFSNQRIIDIAKLQKEASDYDFTHPIAVAIYEAVQSEYTEIRLYRVSCSDGEYREEAESILNAVRYAQAQGVAVYHPWFADIKRRLTTMPEMEKVAPKPKQTTEPTVKELKQAIKDLGGTLPKGRASKKKLIETLEGLQHGNE